MTNLPFDVMNHNCPSRKVFGKVTGRWGSLVLRALQGKQIRFGQLRRDVAPISDKMLAKTLNDLADIGLVKRESWEGNPPHVEYHLTQIGEKIASQLVNLMQTLEKVMPEVLDSQNTASQDKTN